jgi:HlyD family secretion protein
MLVSILSRFSFWLALCGIIAAVLFMRRTNVPEPMPPLPHPPPTKPAGHSIAASGLVEAFGENVNIGVAVPGLITEVKVKVWDKVKKGDALILIDDRELRAQLLLQDSQVVVTQAQQARLKEQLDRLKSVDDPQAVSQEEISTKVSDYAIAEAQTSAAEAAVAQTKLLLERLIVTAPRDGVILQVNVRAGESVTGTAAKAPIVLGNLDYFQIRADVDEQLAPQIKADLPATGYLKGDTTNPLPLEFVRIEPYIIPKVSLTGSSSERVDTRVLQIIYRIKADPELHIYPGQQMDIYIKDTP